VLRGLVVKLPYWQALDLVQGLPSTPERNRVHVETICALASLAGWARDEASRTQMLRHVHQTLACASEGGEFATVACLECLKGRDWDDEGLHKTAMAHADASGDAIVRRDTTTSYAAYLGKRGRYATALDYIARARDIDAPKEQLFWLDVIGRCFSARAGRLEAASHRAIAEALGDVRMQAWSAIGGERHMYMGHWDKIIEVTEMASLGLGDPRMAGGPLVVSVAWPMQPPQKSFPSGEDPITARVGPDPARLRPVSVGRQCTRGPQNDSACAETLRREGRSRVGHGGASCAGSHGRNFFQCSI
jgi:hypothetical protein